MSVTPDAQRSPTVRAPNCVLGFDFGTRRIGMAVGQGITGTAQALAVIANSGEGVAWDGIDQAVRTWRPQVLVVGLPLTLEGAEQAISRGARAFASALRARYHLPVHEQDERLTSVEADRRFAAARRAGTRRAKHAKQLDAIAAQVIVENFLAESAGLPAQETR
jgi:putative Holliday junction resolvase